MKESLPFSQACENNKQPIAEVLQRHLSRPGRLLEIGSGTGQHGYYFSQLFPHIDFQPSDREEYLPHIRQWVQAACRPNFNPPLELDVNQYQPQSETYDYLFSANTSHIMSWTEVERFFSLIPRLLKGDGLFFLYGPFNYQGKFTSQSNARFDQWLKAQAPHQGIRNFEDIDQLAKEQGLQLLEDNPMPANNRTLVWQMQSEQVSG